MPKARTVADVVVDFPQTDESIASPSYTFRIAAPAAESVEVSVNGTPWQPCRRAEGYWWYDWKDYLPGRHRLVARMLRNGDSLVSPARRFRVEPAPAPVATRQTQS